MNSAPMPGVSGQIIHVGNGTYFFEDNGAAWRMIGNHAVPVSVDQAHVIAEDITLSKIEGPEPIKGIPYDWPGTVPEAEPEPVPVKVEPVCVNTRDRQDALKDLLGDLCRSGDAVEAAPDVYRSNITQSELCNRWAVLIGTRHGTSARRMGAALDDVGVSVEWSKSRRK